MSTCEEIRSFLHELEGVEDHQDLACEKSTSVEAKIAKAAVQSNRDLARLQQECDSSPQHTVTAESSLSAMRKDYEAVTAKFRDLESENAKLRMELETSSKTRAKTEAALAKDHRETHDKIERKTRECDACRAKVCKLKKRLASLLDEHTVNDKKMQRLELQVGLDATTIAHLVTLVKNNL